MFAVLIYLTISVLLATGLFIWMSKPNEDCNCGQCDEHDETWHLLRAKMAELNFWQFGIFWCVFTLLALPLLTALLVNMLYDYLCGNSENAV